MKLKQNSAGNSKLGQPPRVVPLAHQSGTLVVFSKIAAVGAALGFFLIASHLALSAGEEPAGQPPAAEKSPASVEGAEVPSIPKSNMSIDEALRIRNNLELMREDVQIKLRSLAQAKISYERTKKDVEEKLRAIKEENKLLDETLQKEKASKTDRLKEALLFIEKMEPRKAAPVVEAMDKDLVIALFKKLPPRNVTRILENVSPQKATQLMEYYTRIRSGREYSLLRELGLCQPEEDTKKQTSPAQQGANQLENSQQTPPARDSAQQSAQQSAPPASGAGENSTAR